MEGPQPIKNKIEQEESVSQEITEDLLNVDDSQEDKGLLGEEELKQINERKEKLRQDFNFEELVEKYAKVGYRNAVKNWVINCDYEVYLAVAKQRYEVLLDTIPYGNYLFENYRLTNKLDSNSKISGWLGVYRKEWIPEMFGSIFDMGYNKVITRKLTGVQDYYYKEWPAPFRPLGDLYYNELDKLFSQKPDIILVVPKGGIPPAILIKKICKTASEINSNFNDFNPEFKIPPFKIKYIAHLLGMIKNSKEVSEETKGEVLVGRKYFRDLIVYMYKKGYNKLMFCDDVIVEGYELRATKFLIDDAVEGLKIENLISRDYEVSFGNVTNGGDHILNSNALSFMRHGGYGVTMKNSISKPEDRLMIKFLHFIGKQITRDYFALNEIRDTPDRVYENGLTVSNKF